METSKKTCIAKEAAVQIEARIASLWPGFSATPFILYDDKNYVRFENGDIFTSDKPDSILMGNTATMYKGKVYAIWDTRTWVDSPTIDKVASCLTHEMFHAHQQFNFKVPWANELLFPQYPHTARSIALVVQENKWLQRLAKTDTLDSVLEYLHNIVQLRKLREAEIGAEFIQYDTGSETFEGTASYVEVKMVAAITSMPVEQAAAPYLELLEDNSNLLTGYRRRLYAVGLALCLAADRLWGQWQEEWVGSGKTMYGWICDKIGETACHVNYCDSDTEYNCDEATQLLQTFRRENEQKITAFMSQPLTEITGDIKLLTFDPMNLTCNENYCLHLHGRVKYNGCEHALTAPFLTEIGNNIFDIKRILRLDA